jgi:hypothetical protein
MQVAICSRIVSRFPQRGWCPVDIALPEYFRFRDTNHKWLHSVSPIRGIADTASALALHLAWLLSVAALEAALFYLDAAFV